MMNDLKLQLTYALAKQVPDMERGFRIETSFGPLVVDEEDALAFAALAKNLFKKKLTALRGADLPQGLL